MNKKRILPYILLGVCLIFSTGIFSQKTIPVFDNVLYYDGYKTAVYDSAVTDGVLRLRNDLYSKKLSTDQLADFGNEITMTVTIKAACDNYDRIGNVNLALVPKGATSYKTDNVKRIELGRYITPFMDKNKQPDNVPYTYNVDYLKHIFKDKNLLSQYDFWIELELFGVPYAANTQISGCNGRNDVFYGSLNFVTSTPSISEEDNTVLIPLYIKHDFNNYTIGATDEIGKTVKSTDFWVTSDLSDAQLVLITSNHGSNANGEEYSRRTHYAYFDGTNVLTYIPGLSSCEPFRKYNTQANGIYGSYARNDATWQSFSNWCPGAAIINRVIPLGHISTGNHTFRIEVPDAKFLTGQGNIPLSLYLIGKTQGTLSAVNENTYQGISVFPNPVQSVLTFNTEEPLKVVKIYNITGQKVFQGNTASVDIKYLPLGVYSVCVEFDNGKMSVYKIIKK